MKLTRDFFARDPVTCARELIGCKLVWGHCGGVVVETEAYAAVNDEACHTWSRPSARDFVAKHRAGAAYVYFNYGMHWMLNVLVKGGTEDGFVLIRALKPSMGLAVMARRRAMDFKTKGEKLKASTALCSGPGKLGQALAVTSHDHGRDFCDDGGVGFFPRVVAVEVQTDVRVGISRAGDLPWRFLLRGSAHISVKPKAGRVPFPGK